MSRNLIIISLSESSHFCKYLEHISVQPVETTLTVSKNPATKGDTVTLTCSVEGYPGPEDPTVTKDSSTSVTVSCSGTTNAKTCKKVFTDIQFTDNGNYVCVGKNTIDSVVKTSSKSVDWVVSKWYFVFLVYFFPVYNLVI